VKMQYKPIENCHMANAVLGKDFNLGMIDFLFHLFTHNELKTNFKAIWN